jgi:hypothetical protein
MLSFCALLKGGLATDYRRSQLPSRTAAPAEERPARIADEVFRSRRRSRFSYAIKGIFTDRKCHPDVFTGTQKMESPPIHVPLFSVATAMAIVAARLIPFRALPSSLSRTVGSMKSSVSAYRGDTSDFRSFAIGSPSSFRRFAAGFTARTTEYLG